MTSPVVYGLTNLMPSYSAQTLMDVSAFLNRPVTGGIYNTHKKAGDHLKDLWLREQSSRPQKPGLTRGDLRAQASEALRIGQVYRRADVGWLAALKLLGWTLLGYAAAWLGLRARERG